MYFVSLRSVIPAKKFKHLFIEVVFVALLLSCCRYVFVSRPSVTLLFCFALVVLFLKYYSHSKYDRRSKCSD